jgi:hypothetical protein
MSLRGSLTSRAGSTRKARNPRIWESISRTIPSREEVGWRGVLGVVSRISQRASCNERRATSNMHLAPRISQTLHLAPCTLHLTPCTLHLTPCTLLLASRTQHPAPPSLHHTPALSSPYPRTIGIRAVLQRSHRSDLPAIPIWIKGCDLTPIGAVVVSGLPQKEDHQVSRSVEYASIE